MKFLLLILCLLPPFLLDSCTSIGPNGVIALGSNATKIHWTPTDATVEGLNNSDAFREGASTIRTGLTIWGTVAMAKATIDGLTSTRNTEQAAGVAKHAATQTTKRASIEANKAIKTFVPPEAAPAVVAPVPNP